MRGGRAAVRELALLGCVLGVISLGWSRPVCAQETWLLDLEGDLGHPLNDPHRKRFGFGATLGVGVLRSLTPYLAAGARLRLGVFGAGDAVMVEGVREPGAASMGIVEAAVRLRVPDASPRRAPGPWLEISGGGGFSGSLLRPSLGLAVGWSFDWNESWALGPHFRYLQVLHFNGGVSNEDASLDSGDGRVLLVGLTVTGLDVKPQTRVVEREPERPKEESEGPDGDGDGLLDADDSCPDRAEDVDGYQDDDGCPDFDNDEDGIFDHLDACPNIPEDKDGFEDEDGCLDDDNDDDGILDTDDQCPLEAEVINGVDDEDGCPDEGLIEMHDDRIVLAERVLFDSERARVRARGRPVLEALVQLTHQHPEWTKVRIEGHADRRGDSDFNRPLSERRAINVRRALINLGMEPSLLIAEGYGASRPISDENTEEAHRLNRRVEFVVIATRGRYEPGEEPVEAESEGAAEQENIPAEAGAGGPGPVPEPGGSPAQPVSDGKEAP